MYIILKYRLDGYITYRLRDAHCMWSARQELHAGCMVYITDGLHDVLYMWIARCTLHVVGTIRITCGLVSITCGLHGTLTCRTHGKHYV